MLSKHSSDDKPAKSSIHCSVYLIYDRLKRSFPVYSSRANLLAKNSEILSGEGQRYLAQK